MIPSPGDSSASSGRGESCVRTPGKANRSFILLLLAVSLAASARPAFAWGALGHQVIGALAEDMLTPKAKERVRNILATAEKGGPAGLASVSTWADEVRMLRPETRPWHYVTLQLAETRYDPAKADSSDVVKALKRQLAVLGAPGALAAPGSERYAREEALKWTVHLIGDLHQPLHTGEDRDRGGNLAKVRLNRRTYNLHELWDHVLLDRLGLPPDSLRRMLERDIAADPGFIRRNAKGTVEDWVDETHAKAARCYVLRGKPMRKGIKVQLDKEYARASTLAILEQLRIGGVRLAFALNRALDPGGPAVPPVPTRKAPGPGGPAGLRSPDAYFERAGEILDPEEVPGAGRPARAAGKSGDTGGAYAWSVHSKVYHASACPDAKGIKRANLRTGEVPPPGLEPHAGCLGGESRPRTPAVPRQERVK